MGTQWSDVVSPAPTLLQRAAVLFSSGLPAKACPLPFLVKDSSNLNAVLLSIFLSE